MTLSELIRPGDKIDIQLSYQLEQQRMGNDIEVKNFKSSVFDYASDTELEISMPTEGTKMVLFQVGLRCEMVFYTRKGLYSCQTIVKDRRRKENLYSLIVEIKTPPSKFQRREFFRVDCTIDMAYYNISEEFANLSTTEAVFRELQTPKYYGKQIPGVIQDISGGGIRFSSPLENEKDSYVLTVVRLTNDKLDETFYLICKIISCNRIEHATERFSNRAKFIFKDISERETIVRFVFEEERRIRKKENG